MEKPIGMFEWVPVIVISSEGFVNENINMLEMKS